MNPDEQQHLERLKKTYARNLEIYEQQAATLGISAPPYVLIQIDDLKEKIADIDRKLAADAPAKASSAPAKNNVTKILFLAADPTDAARLRLGEEVRSIQERLQMAQFRDRFSLEQRMSVRPADISQALLDVQPQIVHFSGHGTDNGALCFETPTGHAQPVEPAALAALFEQFAGQVQCVVLNACFSRKQANGIAKHIPYVVGMKRAIGDKAAIAFSIGFYQAIGAGRSVPQAYKLGCAQIQLQGIAEHLTPTLVSKKAA